MPRGSKAGERRGGRKRGTPNRKTVERQLVAQRLLQGLPAGDIEGAARPLAKDVLAHWIAWAHSRARYWRNRNAAKCGQYVEIAAGLAKALAPFESPTYRAIVMTPPPPAAEETKRFTLKIFDPYNGPGTRLVYDREPQSTR